jgi:hypothetical protein
MTARLYGLMTLDFEGQQISWPTELTISSVPLQWMGQVFNGTVKANSLTDQVHGSISADGQWLLTLTYSRQVVQSASGVNYSVKLRNVPIGSSANDTVKAGNFEKTGDVAKYVEEIGYVAGPPKSTYISIDWANSGQGLQPILEVTFEKEPSQVIGPPGSLQAPGGM